jgi:hypothetical protein
MFSLANSVVSGLLGSKGGTISDGLGKESNVLNGSSEFLLSGGKHSLGVGDGLLTLGLGCSVSITLSSSVGDFSIASHDIFVVLSISGSLFSLSLGNKLVNKSNNIINNTFGSEVNL